MYTAPATAVAQRLPLCFVHVSQCCGFPKFSTRNYPTGRGRKQACELKLQNAMKEPVHTFDQYDGDPDLIR